RLSPRRRQPGAIHETGTSLLRTWKNQEEWPTSVTIHFHARPFCRVLKTSKTRSSLVNGRALTGPSVRRSRRETRRGAQPKCPLRRRQLVGTARIYPR